MGLDQGHSATVGTSPGVSAVMGCSCVCCKQPLASTSICSGIGKGRLQRLGGHMLRKGCALGSYEEGSAGRPVGLGKGLPMTISEENQGMSLLGDCVSDSGSQPQTVLPQTLVTLLCLACAFYPLVKMFFCSKRLLKHHLDEHCDISQLPPPPGRSPACFLCLPTLPSAIPLSGLPEHPCLLLCPQAGQEPGAQLCAFAAPAPKSKARHAFF